MTERAWMDDEDYKRLFLVLAHTVDGRCVQIAEHRGKIGLRHALIRAKRVTSQWLRVTVVEQVQGKEAITHFDSAEASE